MSGKMKKYRGPKRWDAILKRIPMNKKVIGAEIGVLNGNTAARLLKARPLLVHIMIDPWKVIEGNFYERTEYKNVAKTQQGHEKCYQLTLNRVSFAGKRGIIKRMTSAQAAPQIPDKSLDFVFVDGDHSYEGTKLDIQLWLPKIRAGGWIGGHDYKHVKRPDLHGVDKAVEEFFTKEEIKTDIDHTWFVRL